MSDTSTEQKKYIEDPRTACKYGIKCFRKNSAHLAKYKHPPRKQENDKNRHTVKKLKIERKDQVKEVVTKKDVSDSDDYNIEDVSDTSSNSSLKNRKIKKISNDISESEISESEDDMEIKNSNISDTDDSTDIEKGDEEISDSSKASETNKDMEKINKDKENETNTATDSSSKRSLLKESDLDKHLSHHEKFIKEHFLVFMPKDFYQFWDFCTKLKQSNPLGALKDIGLTLVGPFDVLAGKFRDVTKSPDEYLIHWRYYRDPPEFQTVLKGDDRVGYHIGYFRDVPEEPPVFLCSNQSKKDGVLTQMGGNIFAAVNFYLEDLKKFGDPFKKMHIGRIQSALKVETERLKINLSRKTSAMVSREKKIVSRTLNKIGLVVQCDKKTQVGYRELALGNKDINILLTKLQNSKPEEKSKYLSQLQPVFTFANIATDECDFGTGVELGWSILSHGIDSLNSTISDFLVTNYRLLNKEAFAKIADAHMKNRKKSCELSIL